MRDNFWKRLAAIVLCAAMMMSIAADVVEATGLIPSSGTGAGGGTASSPTEVTQGVSKREADPSTMDSFKDILDFASDSRNAGRIWADKSVFAYGDAQTAAFDGNTLKLDMATDGSDESIKLDADFLHVYSLLGSSQEVIGVPPVRTVIVFDNSGSMYNSYNGSEFDRQRIAMTVEAINRAIDALMMSGRYNEVSVVLFGDGANENDPAAGTFCYNGNNTAVTILPMKHYTPDKEVIEAYEKNGSAGSLYTKYLTAGWQNDSENPDGSKPNQTTKKSNGWVFVDNEKCGLKNYDGEGKGYNGSTTNRYTAYANGTTNIQAGYYVGMQELLKADKTVTVGTQTYKCVPSLIMLTDGQTTDMLDGTYITPAKGNNSYPKSRGFVNDTGNKLRSFVGVKGNSQGNKNKEISNFWDMFVAKDASGKYYSAGYADDVTFSDTTSPYDYEGDSTHPEAFTNMKDVAETYSDSVASMVLGTLMTTAYYKEAVRKAFDMGEDNWKIYTVSVDMTDMSTVETNAVQKAKDADSTEPTYELPKSWEHTITSNPVTMDPSEYFKLGSDNVADLSWLKDKGYIDSDVENNDLTDPDKVIEHTGYPDYSVGEMMIQGITKAAKYLKDWADGEEVETKYQSWQEKKSVFNDKDDNGVVNNWDTSKKVNPWNHGNGYLLEAEQTITWPQVSADPKTNPYGVTKDDVLKNIDYNGFAYYPSTAKGSAAELTNVFVEIVNDIMEPLFEPVGGMNDLGGQDAITYMDPVGKYMDVKDVKNVLLFGDLYGIVKTAVYDFQFNDAYVKAHPDMTAGETNFPEGWYKGDDGSKITGKGDYSAECPVKKDGKDDPEGAWAAGWVYRINTVTASQFVPNISNVDKPDEANEKLRATKYTFYRFDNLTDEKRNELHMNPAYGTEDKTEKDANGDDTDTAFGKVVKAWEAEHDRLTKENGVSTYPVENGIYSSLPGVYRLSDIRIWVEDTGSYSAIVDGDTGVESDDNFDEAIWINVPTSALPLRIVTINLAHTSGTGSTDATATYSTNAGSGKDALPLRVFYTVGVSDEVRNEDNYINIASEIGPNYLDRYKITTSEQKNDRNLETGNVEFFSNWYNSERKYSDYTSVDTEYSFGDPVMTFSPALSNRYYVFQAPTPLYLAPKKDYPSAELGSQIEIERSALKDDGITVNGEVCPYVTTADQIGADNYYYILTDYYEFDKDSNTATPKLVAELRKGTEFGGGFGDGNYTLCWYNVNNTEKIETKPFTTGRDIPKAAEGQKWVLAAATGGIRTGDSHRDRTVKGTSYLDETPMHNRYLNDNTTRTANTVLLPTVSSTTVNSAANTANGIPAPAAVSEGDGADGSESKDSTKIRLDMYLGNNGRLAVMDSVLLLTKEVDMGPLSDTEAAPNSEEEFEFEVTLESRKYQSGSFDAVRVVKNSAGQWQRIIDYIDLELDAKMFLQNEKGDPVTVNEKGEVDENGQYYVYVGANQDNGGHESLGNDERNFRIFHTSYHEGFNRVGQNDVKVEFEYKNDAGKSIYSFQDPEKTPPTIKENNVTYTRTGKRKFYLTHVWLFSKQQYDAYEVEKDSEGNIIDPTSGKYTKELSYGENGYKGFLIMDYDPNSEESTEVKLTTDYLYNSAYLSQTVEFNVGKAAVTLHSDEGLLFNSIPNDTPYTITETLTDEQIAKGYDFDKVKHTTYVTEKDASGKSTGEVVEEEKLKANFGGSTSYSVTGNTSGYESAAHYINTWTTNKSETSINDVTPKKDPNTGLYPSVQVNDTITYHIKWANNTDDPAVITVTDKLDPGVDFVSAGMVESYAEGKDYPVYTDDSITSEDNYTNGNIDGKLGYTIKYDPATHTVQWLIGRSESDLNLGGSFGAAAITPVPQGAFGEVELTVRVNDKAHELWSYADDDPTKEGTGDRSEDDFLVHNKAKILVGDNSYNTDLVTNPVEGPDKDETEITDGDGTSTKHITDSDGEYSKDGTWTGPAVNVGDKITYEITFVNAEKDSALITITDELDSNVSYVEGTDGTLTVTYTKFKKDGTIEDENAKLDVPVKLSYNTESHTVTWVIGTSGIDLVPATGHGKVSLTVQVKEGAVDRVKNKAQVQVGNKTKVNTKTVENHIPEPEKTETNPGNGKLVSVGEDITYEIKWENANPKDAAVVITDPLDDGVDFVSASIGDSKSVNDIFIDSSNHKTTKTVTIDDHDVDVTIEYNDETHTVTWTIEKAPAGASGTVTLKVKVNERAVNKWTYSESANSGVPEAGSDYEVLNRAEVKVDNKATFTATVENPVPEKTETKIDGDAVTEAGTYDVKNHTWTFAEVEVGQTITYSIHYKNSHDTSADVEIVDVLDNGVDFVTASVPVISSMVPGAPAPTSTYSYNKSKHTVTWTLKNVPAHSEGDVTLTVRVNHNATPVEEGENPEGQVKNSATVQVGDDLKTTETVVNPTPQGSFEVTKKAAGSVTADTGDEFTFTVKFESKDNGTLCFSYNETDKTYTMIKDLDNAASGEKKISGNEITFKLKADETMKFRGLPVGTPYTVTEVSDNVSGKYATEQSFNEAVTAEGDKYVIDKDKEGNVVFTNTRRKADITLTKTVENGLPSDNTADFTFTIELKYKNTVYTENIKVDGKDTKAADGKYTVTLKNGGSVNLSDIPTGVQFKITEIMPDGYAGNFNTEFNVTVTVDGKTETLTHDADGWYTIDDSAAEVSVACTNARKTGNLRIDKTVFGDYATDGDREKEFEFKLKLFEGETPLEDNTISAKRYTIGKYNTFENNPYTRDSEGWYIFKLKHNQYIIFEGIPVGAEYTVIEDSEGKYLVYTGTSAEDAAPNDNAQESGKIVEGTNSEHFFNRPKRLPEKTETDPGAGKVVGTGKHITYNIKWSNDHTEPAVVVITDRLDNGVDFVKASLYGVALESGNGKDVSVTGTYGGGMVTIAYDSKSRTVTWTVDKALAGASDSATLEVAVNENADLVWNYDEPEGGTDSDYKVFNRAQVKVGNDSTYTSTVENPVVDISIEKWQSADHADPTAKDQEMTKKRFQVYENDTVTYYLHVTVTGSNGSKLTGVTVYDFVPEELTYSENSGKYGAAADTLANITGLEGGVTYSYDDTNRKIEWKIGDVEIVEGGKTDFWVSFDVNVPYRDWHEWKNTGTVSSNELPDKQSKEVEIYEQYGALRLTKVASEGVPEDREFKFKFQFFDKDGNEITNYSYPYVIEEDVTSTVAANARVSKSPIGAFNFAVNPIASPNMLTQKHNVIGLRSGQTLKIEKLPVGATFKITEIDAADYDISIGTRKEKDAGGTNAPFVEYEHKPDANGNVERSNVMTGTVEFNADTEILNVRYANVCKPTKTETDHEVVGGSNNDHVVYEDVKVGDVISYRIDWHNGPDDNATVTVTDDLDPNVEFVSASYGECVLSAGSSTVTEDSATITYDDHTVTWTIPNVNALASGSVELKVKVKESAVTPGKVENTADVQVDNRDVQHTETVENDVHTGNLKITKAVSGGQQDLETGYNFTLSLTFGNQPLDGTYNYTISDSSKYRKPEEATTGKIGNGGEFTLYNGETISISDLPEGTKYSVIENVDANKFDVYVDGKLNGEISGTITSDTTVKSSFAVANVRKPSKDETAINGTTTPIEQTDESGTNVRVYNDVKVGDVISYRIDWHNGPDDNATVTVTDDLDPNVEFVSASYGECVLSAGSSTVTEDSAAITYDDHTVTWTISNVKALASGYVELKVKVKAGAVVSKKVDNKAEVRIGDNYKQETETVENNVNKGNLIVTKKVTGIDGSDLEGIRSDVGFSFTFKFTYTDMETHEIKPLTGEYSYSINSVVKGKIRLAEGTYTVDLKHDDTVEIFGLPEGTHYEITENELDRDKYDVEFDNGSGDIVGDKDASVTVNNIYFPEPHKTETKPDNGQNVTVGDQINYEISWQNPYDRKTTVTVVDNFDKNTDFFSASYGDVELTVDEGHKVGNSYEITQAGIVTITYDPNSHTVTWTIENVESKSSGSVKLSVKVNQGAITNEDGTGKVKNGATVKVGNNSQQTEKPENIVVSGGLSVEKIVVGAGGDTAKEFHIVVTLKRGEDAAADINGKYGEMTFNGGVAEFDLKHGESITASELPVGLTYTVEETNGDGYDVIYTNETGIIPTNDTAKAVVTNRKDVTPAKTETDPGDGEEVKIGREITYEITWANNETEERNMTVTDVLDEGLDFVSADNGGTYDKAARTVTWNLGTKAAGTYGVVTLTVKVNEKAVRKGEVENSATVKYGTHSDVVGTPANPVPSGSLRIEKLVTGTAGDLSEDFTFEICFYAVGEDGVMTKLKEGYPCDIDRGVDVPVPLAALEPYDKVVHSGDTFTLKHGESFTVTGLPAGVIYEVLERRADGYVTTVESADATFDGSKASGTTEENHEDVVTFYNSKDVPVPETEPEKFETNHDLVSTDNDGNRTYSDVKVGDQIDYRITFENNDAEAADVTITDELDSGVEFLSASYGSVTLTADEADKFEKGYKFDDGNVSITYEADTHTVTWVIKNVPGGESGAVELSVIVTENAVSDHKDKVENDAVVQVGNKPEQRTKKVENPVYTGGLSVTKVVVGEASGKDQDKAFEFTVTFILNNKPLENKYPYVKSTLTDESETNSGKIGSGDTFTLKNGQSITVTGLPEGTEYTVTEINADGYEVKAVGNTEADIVREATAKVTFENRPIQKPHKEETDPGDGMSVGVGDTITYKITWHNDKFENATVTIRDPLDNGVDFVSADNGGVYDAESRTVTWTINAEPESKGTVTLAVKVNKNALDNAYTVDNTAYVRVNNESEQETETVRNPAAEVDIRKEQSAVDQNGKEVHTRTTEMFSVEEGDKVTYYLTVTATGAEGAVVRNVRVRDAVPEGLKFIDADNGGTLAENGYVCWELGDMRPGESKQVSFRVEVPYRDEATVWTNVAEVTSDNPEDPEDPEYPWEPSNEVKIDEGHGSLSVTKTVTGSAGDKNKNFTFTFRFTDPKGDDIPGSYPYTITRTAPESGISPASEHDDNADGYVSSGGTIALSDGDTVTINELPVGTLYSVTESDNEGYEVDVTGSSGEIKVNDTAVASFINHRDLPHEPEKTEVEPGAGADVTVGQEITYSITWENPYDKESEVVITDPLDKGLDFVSADCEGVKLEKAGEVTENGITVSYAEVGEGRTVKWTFVAQPNTKGSVTLTVRVNENALTIVENTASVSIDHLPEQRTNPVDNPVVDPDVTIEKFQSVGDNGEITKTPLNVRPGDIVTYYLKVTSTGKTTAKNVTVRDAVPKEPSGLTLDEILDGGKLVTPSDPYGFIEWDLGDMEPGEEKTVRFRVLVPKVETATTWVNIGEVTYDHPDEPEDPWEPSNEVEIEEKVGGISVTKTVIGSENDQNTEFNFRIELSDSTISGTYGDLEFAYGIAVFKLKHNETVTVKGLPEGTEYTVSEQAESGFETVFTGEVGKVVNDVVAEVEFTNRRVCDLTVRKMISGDNPDLNAGFTFTVTLDDTSINGRYGDMFFTNGVVAFTLKHGESKTAKGLPYGIGYTVAEAEAEGYTPETNGSTGIIGVGSGTVMFVNIPFTPGSLKISKSVEGFYSGERFEFTVVLTNANGEPLTEAFDVVYSNQDTGTIISGGIIILGNGESAVINGLPFGTHYMITENVNEDYTSAVPVAEGVISGFGEAASVSFVNVRKTGGFSVTKTVSGTGSDPAHSFEFTATLSDTSISGQYGDLTFINGVAVFTLAHGETVTAAGLPVGITYTVTENSEDYIPSSSNESGVIGEGGIIAVTFNNHKDIIPVFGGLTVTKTVSGTAGDMTKPFTFTVTLSDKSVNGRYGDMFFINGIATFTLTHGQSATATDLPAGIGYTVTESDNEGYAVTFIGETGVIPENANAQADFFNNKDIIPTGSLSVTKTVTGHTSPEDFLNYFTFVFTFTDAEGNPLPDPYHYSIGSGTEAEGEIVSGGMIRLRHGETVTVYGLPEGTRYSVSEIGADGYIPNIIGGEGVISSELGMSATVSAYNDKPAPPVGDITVTKTVSGTAADYIKQFSFTMTLSDASINGTYGDLTFMNGVAVFTLSHGQSVTASGLPAGIGYSVIENSEDYTVTVDNPSGIVIEGTSVTVNFNNHKDAPPTGGLTVVKTVAGSGADYTRYFSFTVVLSDTSINGQYGGMFFVNGVANFMLRHGESISASGLPAGVTYRVYENDAGDYIVTPSGDSGVIIPDSGAVAEFVNYREEPYVPTGDLTVTKTVTGNAADMTKEFTFTVILSDMSINGQYGDMYFSGGVAFFTLRHGESAVASGLPEGISYSVTEADSDGYEVSSSGESGVIAPGARADFVNNKDEEDDEPDELTGSLTVTKKVTGSGIVSQNFTFTVTLSEPLTGQYGDMYFSGGVTTFTLRHGQSMSAVGLPDGISYSVTESDNEYYTVTAVGADGVIIGGGSAYCEYINDLSEEDYPKVLEAFDLSIPPEDVNPPTGHGYVDHIGTAGLLLIFASLFVISKNRKDR